MLITRELALEIIHYLLKYPHFQFPFKVMCKGYASQTNDANFVEIVPNDDYENLLADFSYDNFELWEQFGNFDKSTIELMSKGFLEKILSDVKK